MKYQIFRRVNLGTFKTKREADEFAAGRAECRVWRTEASFGQFEGKGAVTVGATEEHEVIQRQTVQDLPLFDSPQEAHDFLVANRLLDFWMRGADEEGKAFYEDFVFRGDIKSTSKCGLWCCDTHKNHK